MYVQKWVRKVYGGGITTIWRDQNNKIHREDGPAVIWPDGSMFGVTRTNALTLMNLMYGVKYLVERTKKSCN